MRYDCPIKTVLPTPTGELLSYVQISASITDYISDSRLPDLALRPVNKLMKAPNNNAHDSSNSDAKDFPPINLRP